MNNSVDGGSLPEMKYSDDETSMRRWKVKILLQLGTQKICVSTIGSILLFNVRQFTDNTSFIQPFHKACLWI